MQKNYDIVVSGGGLAGAFASIAAARTGKQVLLIERYGFLGGSLTACGVGPMMTAYAGDIQVIRGLFEEMTQRLIQGGYSCGHTMDTTGYVSYLTPFSAEGMKLILDEMVVESGCHILFHTMMAAVSCDNTRINSITICNKDGLTEVAAEIFIDATGDGDLFYRAGAPMKKGRIEDGKSQPMTLNMRYCNVDRNLLKSYILDHLEEFPRLKKNRALIERAERMSIAGFSTQLHNARLLGEITFEREELLFFETEKTKEFIVNTTRIVNKDGTDAISLSEAEVEGRKQCRELDCFLRKKIPGFADAILEYTGPFIGVRSSRQLCGVYELQEEDIQSGRLFYSRVALAAYPIDIHNPNGAGTDSSFVTSQTGYYSIPYEVMFCNEVENLLVTGRCISASFAAQAAIRTTPTTAALGQAAGIVAAIAVENHCLPPDISYEKLKDQLVGADVLL